MPKCFGHPGPRPPKSETAPGRSRGDRCQLTRWLASTVPLPSLLLPLMFMFIGLYRIILSCLALQHMCFGHTDPQPSWSETAPGRSWAGRCQLTRLFGLTLWRNLHKCACSGRLPLCVFDSFADSRLPIPVSGSCLLGESPCLLLLLPSWPRVLLTGKLTLSAVSVSTRFGGLHPL